MHVFSEPSSAAIPCEDQAMTGKGDGELLKLYGTSHSEAAFRELVRRHSGVVQAAARRRLGGDDAMADDVVQQTFILLARHPARAARAISLAAWLHRAATYEAANVLRGEMRHRRRTAEASGTADLGETDPPDAWLAALPFLDEVLASLNETDRSLIVMHHMEGLSYEQVGERLRCSSSAAQRRGHRALEKLAARLKRRQGNVSVGALVAGLGVVVTPNPAHAVMAGRALTAGGTAGAGGTGLLASLLSPLALGTAVVLVGGTALAYVVQSTKPAPAPSVELAAKPEPATPPALQLPPRPVAARQPVFQPERTDDKLTADELAFINLAKIDPAAAMTWARTKFPASNPLFTFLQSAVRALADRDLPAADRLLSNAGVSTRDVFECIFASRLKRDFAGAVRWADEWNVAHPTEPQSPFLQYLNHNSGEWRPDLRQMLTASRSPQVRENLIHMEAQRLMAEDEAGLEPFAESLAGEERLRVLEYHVSLLLIRGDARALEALCTIQPQRLHEVREMVLRDPAMILDYHMSQKRNLEKDSFYQSANYLFVEWEREDPGAAEAWAAKYTERQRFDHAIRGLRQFRTKGGGK